MLLSRAGWVLWIIIPLLVFRLYRFVTANPRPVSTIRHMADRVLSIG